MASFLEDFKAYIGWTDHDSNALNDLRLRAASHYQSIADQFYETIQRQPRAAAVFSEGMPQVLRLKQTLVSWLDSGLSGPLDDAYYQRRARIGRMHVKVDLPQHLMFAAMDGVRIHLKRIAQETGAGDLEQERRTANAIDKWLDLELAIMLETYREDHEARLKRGERLATIGQLAGTIGHELRNPLSVIESSVYLLKRRAYSDPFLLRHLERISTQVHDASGIITDLLEMVRDRPPRREPSRLAPFLRAVIVDAGIRPEIATVVECVETLEVPIDPGLIRRALLNLLSNAAVAIGEEIGTIRVAALMTEGHLELSVIDTGPGFDPDFLGVAFEPLVSSREGGVGLGLALVRRVAERHGGKATATMRPEGGAEVTMTLPIDERLLPARGD